jgi:hypothetical protein
LLFSKLDSTMRRSVGYPLDYPASDACNFNLIRAAVTDIAASAARRWTETHDNEVPAFRLQVRLEQDDLDPDDEGEVVITLWSPTNDGLRAARPFVWEALRSFFNSPSFRPA